MGERNPEREGEILSPERKIINKASEKVSYILENFFDQDGHLKREHKINIVDQLAALKGILIGMEDQP